MRSRFLGTPADIMRADIVINHQMDAFLSAIDVLQQDIGLQEENWKYNYKLVDWTYNNTALQHLIFTIDLPENYKNNSNNYMHYQLNNLNYLEVYNLGTITNPLKEGRILTVKHSFKWGIHDGTTIYLYVPAIGRMEDKFVFWLPVDYTTVELNAFFNRSHAFMLTYEKEFE